MGTSLNIRYTDFGILIIDGEKELLIREPGRRVRFLEDLDLTLDRVVEFRGMYPPGKEIDIGGVRKKVLDVLPKVCIDNNGNYFFLVVIWFSDGNTLTYRQ